MSRKSGAAVAGEKRKKQEGEAKGEEEDEEAKTMSRPEERISKRKIEPWITDG